MGPNDAGWLFRDGDLILGPVAAQVVIDKLYAGELTAQTDVQQLGSGRFVKLGEVPDFKVHVAKAEAKKRVDAHAEAHRSHQQKQTRRGMLIGVGVLATLGIVVAVIGSYVAVHGWGASKSAEELAWGDITLDAPTISKAQRNSDDEFVDYQGGKRTGGTLASTRTPTTRPPTGSKADPTDPDGMSLGEVDTAGINAVVARNKSSLIPCIKSVAKPGVFMKIPIEFSIAEAGKVSKVWVDNSDLKGSGLEQCLLKELQKWPFQARHSGNSVNLSFNVGTRG